MLLVLRSPGDVLLGGNGVYSHFSGKIPVAAASPIMEDTKSWSTSQFFSKLLVPAETSMDYAMAVSRNPLEPNCNGAPTAPKFEGRARRVGTYSAIEATAFFVRGARKLNQ